MKEKLLLEALIKEQPLTVEELSKKINASERSIYNYIKEINKSDKIIISTRFGYIGDRGKLNKYLKDNEESFIERPNNILLKLLLSDESLDYFELVDYFYVSESTILNDVSIINRKIKKRGAKVVRKDSKLFLDCSINIKKSLLETFIQEEKNIK